MGIRIHYNYTDNSLVGDDEIKGLIYGTGAPSTASSGLGSITSAGSASSSVDDELEALKKLI